MNNEEVKEEVKKIPGEVEEVSKKVAEEVPEEVQVAAEEVEQKSKPNFTNITKLKCDYTVYKREREALKMHVIDKCQNCNKKFKEGDFLYSAYVEDKDTKQNYIICKKCAKK